MTRALVQTLAPAVVAVLAIGVIIGLFVALIGVSRRREEAMTRAAARWGGWLVEGGFFSRSYVRLSFAGLPARLSCFAGGKNAAPFTRVEADGVPVVTLDVRARGFFTTIGSWFGTAPVSTGDPAVESHFIVYSNSPAFAARVLRGGVVDALRRWYDRDVTLDVSAKQIRVGIVGCLPPDEMRTVQFVEDAETIVAAVTLTAAGRA